MLKGFDPIPSGLEPDFLTFRILKALKPILLADRIQAVGPTVDRYVEARDRSNKKKRFASSKYSNARMR